MTSKSSPPTFAPRIWRDATCLYLQLSDNMQVLSFAFTEAGLSRALRFIPNCADHGAIVLNHPSLHVLAGKVPKKVIIARATKANRLKPHRGRELKGLTDIVRNLKEE